MKNTVNLIRDTFLLPWLPKKVARKIVGNFDFAFLIHPRDHSDFSRQYKIVRFFPKKLFAFVASFFGPITVSRMTGLVNKEGKQLDGLLISLLFTPEMLFMRRKAAIKSIIKAANISEKLGAKIIGLGALTSSVSSRGKMIISNVKNIGVTTGHANTAVVVIRNMMYINSFFGLDPSKARVAIIGAAGSVGNATFRLLLKRKFLNFVLIDHKFDLLNSLVLQEKGRYDGAKFELYKKIPDILDVDYVITATNAPYAVLFDKMLQPGTVIFDDAQPSDMDESLSRRMDILPVEAGIIRLKGIDTNFDFGLEYKDDIFGCLGEAMVLSWQGRMGHYVIDNVKNEQLEEMERMLDGIGFEQAELRGFKKVYTITDLERIKKIKLQKLGHS